MGQSIPSIVFREVGSDGLALVGGKVYAYAAGTSTPKDTYTDSTLGTPNANPVVLDARGEKQVWLSPESYKFVVKDSADNTIRTVDNVSAAASASSLSSTSEGDALIGVKRTETGGVSRTQHAINQERMPSVVDFGAVGDGATNDTTAFTNARAAGSGRYHIPGGKTYLIDASPDAWLDPFTAGPSAHLKIGVTTYDISNAIAGPWHLVETNKVQLRLDHSISGNTVQRWQDGTAGTATSFYQSVAIATDSHFLIAEPATNGGSTDILLRRSTTNADPAGNRFNLTFQENIDRLLLSYATTASGAPSFDSVFEVVAGTAPTFTIPAITPKFNQGLTIKQRAAGGYEFSLTRVSSTGAKFEQIGGSATQYIRFADGTMGFFGSAGTAQPTITGSRGANAALASLLTALAALGLIVDSSS